MNEDKKCFLAEYGTEKHLNKAIKDKNELVRKSVIYNRIGLKKEHIDKLVNDPSHQVRISISTDRNLTKEHIDKLVGDYEVQHAVVYNPNLTKEHIDSLLEEEPEIRERLIYHPNLNKEQLTKLSRDLELSDYSRKDAKEELKKRFPK